MKNGVDPETAERVRRWAEDDGESKPMDGTMALVRAVCILAAGFIAGLVIVGALL